MPSAQSRCHSGETINVTWSLDDLRVFCAVADAGHLSATDEAIGFRRRCPLSARDARR
jgi:hypothetical protein